MSGWLTQQWENLTGLNQKKSKDQVNTEYNAAYEPARTGYENLQNIGQEFMDPNSLRNKELLNIHKETSADDAAFNALLRNRAIAQGGQNVSAGQLGMMDTDLSNKTAATTMDKFNTTLQDQFKTGTGLYTSSINNLTKMNVGQMNAGNNQELRNAQLDSAATGFGLNMAGKAGQTIFGMMKEGGYIPEGFEEGDYVEAPMDATRVEQEMGYPNAPQYTMGNPDGVPDEELLMMLMPGVGGLTSGLKVAKGAKKVYNIHQKTKGASDGVLSQWDKEYLKGIINDYLKKSGEGRPIPKDKISLSRLKGKREAVKSKRNERFWKEGEQATLEGFQEGGFLSSAYINTQKGPIKIPSRHEGKIYE